MKKNILLISIISTLSFSLNAQEASKEQSRKQVLSQNDAVLKESLENNTGVDPEKFLLTDKFLNDYSNDRIITRDEFNVSAPIRMEDARDLTHPYLKEESDKISDKDLSALSKMKEDDEFNNLRVNSVYNEGLKFGTQSALYKTMYEFQKDLELMEDEYKKNFNFDLFMLANGKVKPPVIIEVDGGVEKEGNLRLRETQKSYKIYSQAEVVLRAPSYIDYLNFSPIKPQKPNTYLLPRNTHQNEMQAWKDGVQEGWILGIEQANSIINEGLYSLARDYVGMATFFLLSKTGSISMPEYQNMNLGVTSDGENLIIGQEIFEIAKLPEFNENAHNWKPLPKIENFLKTNN